MSGSISGTVGKGPQIIGLGVCSLLSDKEQCRALLLPEKSQTSFPVLARRAESLVETAENEAGRYFSR